MQQKERFKRFINSRIFIGLITILLTLLIILLTSQVSFIFRPFQVFINVVSIPLIISLILYYLFMPIMRYLTQQGSTRNQSIFVVFLLIILIFFILLIWIIPVLRDQIGSLFNEFPNYYNAVSEQISHFINSDTYVQFSSFIESMVITIENAIVNYSETFISNTVASLGSTFGAIVSISLALITAPIMFYYLLKEDYKIPIQLMKFVPTKNRATIRQMIREINQQLSLYIRGQLIVALAVAIMFMIGYSIIGLPYAIALGIISGILNIIPYLGSFIAMIPAVIIAVVHSPFMVLKVLIVALVEQTLEGRIISPKVLGDNLKIHPIVILIVLLTAGQLNGVTGVIIGVPVYAVMKVFLRHGFNYFKKRTKLYDEPVDNQ